MDKEVCQLTAAKILIYSIDLSPVTERVKKLNNWTKTQAQKISDQYRNFLFLKKKYGNKYSLPPSEEIDEYWHNHILFTKKYFNDCMLIFGEYLHHSPHGAVTENGLTISELEQKFENETQKLYYQENNEFIETIIPLTIKQRVKEVVSYLKSGNL